ncbi:hypothetical protein [Amycolatopsis suaedae]|uniref:Uncharacterized protein n=1 Tax=Amycolatopsis suaedae TaxID=2510978 RepID=A0A4Q7IZA9_9PSEU|nr:hypothetical protein [Amycolatopsis suaedae]RZQ59436.1 hypothetical protein EWH70_34570 [Amycolatopsis suaedae]
MSWGDFYRRRDILAALLRNAERDPHAPLRLEDVPGAVAYFRDEPSALLALHYRWSLLLGGRVRTELCDADDALDAVRTAWQATVAEHGTLYAVLDAGARRHPEALAPALENERRMLADAAQLTGPAEPAVDASRVGAALESLLRATPAPAPRRCTAAALWRRLAPST